MSAANLCSTVFENGVGAVSISKVKVKAVCGSYSTAALRHIVLLPE